MSQKYINDQALLEGLKKEENAAFKSIYDQAYKMTEQYIMSNSGNQDDARDLFQESIIVLLRMIRKPDFELKSKISTLMYSINRNLWLKQLRDNRGKEVSLEENLEFGDNILNLEGIDEGNDYDERHEKVRMQMEKMGDLCQKIILHFFYQKMSHDEIAEIMGYTKAYVRVRLFRCMSKLRKELGV